MTGIPFHVSTNLLRVGINKNRGLSGPSIMSGAGVGVSVGWGVSDGTGVSVRVGIVVGVDVGVIVGVLEAAAAVSAADVVASSSGEGPQADNEMQKSIRINPRLTFFVKNIMSLLLMLSGFNETIKI
jgi:hypothetical protein